MSGLRYDEMAEQGRAHEQLAGSRAAYVGGGPARGRARDTLTEAAARLERRARGMRLLAGLIPGEGLTPEAEQAIAELVGGLERP